MPPVDLTSFIPSDPFEKTGHDVAEFFRSATSRDSISKAYSEKQDNRLFVLLTGNEEHKYLVTRLLNTEEKSKQSVEVLGAALNLSSDFVGALIKRGIPFEEARDEMIKEAARIRGLLDANGASHRELALDRESDTLKAQCPYSA